MMSNEKTKELKSIYYSVESAFIFSNVVIGACGVNFLVLLFWTALNIGFCLWWLKKMDTGIISVKKQSSFILLSLGGLIISAILSFTKWLELFGNKPIKIQLKLLFVGMIISLYLIICLPKKKQFDEKMKMVAKGIGLNEEKENELDVVLCKDAATNEDAVIRLKDRYLHMLILGATGTGKTSQILIRMLLQDIKAEHRSIIVLEPKGDFAEQAYGLGKLMNKKSIYFNPTHVDCPTFNPFYGDEDAVIENMCKTFNAINKSNNEYFKVMAETLMRNGLMVLKRLERQPVTPGKTYWGKPATLINFNTLIYNSNGDGQKMINEFKSISNIDNLEKKQNLDLWAWFSHDYFSQNSKTYENTSIVRAQISKLISNKYLRRCLNPEGKPDIMFDDILEDDIILAIGTEKGILQDLGSFLGLFLFLSYQAAVFRRKGTSDTRKPNLLYVDEFQEYADIGFKEILTMGRSYCVSAILATQARAQMGINMDSHNAKTFIEVVSANARNVVLFPGASPEDVKYYSGKFGQVKREQLRRGVTRQKFEFYTMNQPWKPSTQSEQYTEVWEAEFSETDLMFQDFGTITYQIVKNNTLQRARYGKATFIDKELNEQLKKFVDEYKEKQERKQEEYEEKIVQNRMKSDSVEGDQKYGDPIKGGQEAQIV